jgi:uncharacterized protein YhbP (UPF0306 family)
VVTTQQQPVEVPQNVIDYLASEKTMTLATATPGGVPYATTFLYVSEGATIYFWSRATTTTAQHIEQNPAVAFSIDTYSDDLRNVRGVQGTGECSVILSGREIARVAELFGERFPDLQPGTTMSISFFRIVPVNLNFIDNTEEGASAPQGTFGAEFHSRRAFSIYSDLPVQLVDTVGAEVRSVQHAAGDVIARAGGPADKFMVVVEGEVEVIPEGDGEAPVVIGPGRFFGEMAILRDEPRTATLRARTDVTLLSMERDAFRDMVAQSLGTTADFNQLIAQRLKALVREGAPTA